MININNLYYQKDIQSVLNANLPWSKFKGKNILVTGATGLICSLLVDVLMQMSDGSYTLTILSRSKEKALERFGKHFHNPSFNFIEGDIIFPIKSDKAFHYIIHGAGYSYPAAFAIDPVGTLNGNYLGLNQLLQYGVSHGMERLLYLSSGEVYGEGDGRDFIEDYSGYVDILSARSCYPMAKRASENLCIAYKLQYGSDIVIARLSHVYGSTFTRLDNRAYAQFIRNAIEGNSIELKSDGLQKRSYCYVADCVRAIFFVLFFGENGTAYNVAGPPATIKELAQTIADQSKLRICFNPPDINEKKGYSTISQGILNTSKLESLGYKTIYSLKEGIEHTLNILFDENNNTERNI